ncbi:uncharacterized protein RSE6_09433 [Rhynchosporium secalis]|uniref:Uncharacterized protein n=1 Tax=Rhynchosporium secalis TaxID=38038 RepID=A0A1E1MHZ9_RHYSE|nr:uncharacterized protein RSE6_09433 [Rhynchosporium secalis]
MPVIDWKTWDDAIEKRIERSRVLPSALLSGLDVEMLSNDRSVISWLREIPKPTSSARRAICSTAIAGLPFCLGGAGLPSELSEECRGKLNRMWKRKILTQYFVHTGQSSRQNSEDTHQFFKVKEVKSSLHFTTSTSPTALSSSCSFPPHGNRELYLSTIRLITDSLDDLHDEKLWSNMNLATLQQQAALHTTTHCTWTLKPGNSEYQYKKNVAD